MRLYLFTIIALLFLSIGTVHAQHANIGTKIGLNSFTINSGSNFGIDLRYNLGLSDITKSSGSDATNRGLQIGVFYLFNHH
ncbi:MAG: hypothetical protein JJU41_10360 [Bacteroidetes bacterium]|nr:hypothetical protein [Bacteroidota bacterium]MCH8525464.1 hypothetical protein [Balneolales bacterium]